MAAFQKYYKYKATYCSCGIPYVILEGTVEDWKKVKEKCQSLAKYQLPWTDKLDTILGEFINAKEGKINKEFWQTMVRIKDGGGFYDRTVYSGWFTYLFPYDIYGYQLNGRIPVDRDTAAELLKCPLSLDVIGCLQRKTYNLTLFSGFVGIKQDPKTLSLKPEIGWFITESDKQ